MTLSPGQKVQPKRSMRLSAAWRNISVKRTTGTAPEAMMSASTCPGPTEGSWSTSPTSSRAARVGRARNTARIGGTTGRCTQRDRYGLREQDLEDGVDQCRLTDAGTAGDHQHLERESDANS